MRIPVELLLNLAEHLNLRELIKCRLVCKQWRCFIDQFCLDELVLFIRYYPTLEIWKLDGKPIDLRKAISLGSDRCLSDDGFRYIFRNLRKLFLTIRSEQKAYYKLGMHKMTENQNASLCLKMPHTMLFLFPEFPLLEHLEIIRHNCGYYNHINVKCDRQLESGAMEWYGMVVCNADFELNLKSLKRFHVNALSDGIVLNKCPNLSELSFRLVYPSFTPPHHFQKKIRKLTCFYGTTCDQPIWIKKLENLEILYCNNYCDFRDSILLGYLPKLRVLYLYSCYPTNAQWIEAERVRLNRKDLKIYHFGRLGLKCYEEPRRLNWSIYDVDFFLAKFYGGELAELAPTLPTGYVLHFDENFRGYDRRFYAKLTNVQVLYITQGPMRETELIELIGWLPNIVILWMNEATEVNQNFYDLLPDHYPYLRWIHIDNRVFSLNLNFLHRLKHLYKVEFKNLSSVETDPVYRQLVEKVESKRKEIAKISGNLLFEIDEGTSNLEINNYLNEQGRCRGGKRYVNVE